VHDDFEWFLEYFPAIETRNSHMLEQQNAHAAHLARQWKKIGIGGSDAHALPSVGTAYTEVPGARDKEEFFAGLRAGMGRVGGESGRFTKLTRDVFLIGMEMMREKRWTAVLSPLALFIPAAIFLNYRDEHKFSQRWATELFGQLEDSKSPSWIGVPQSAVEEWV
jgi:hypothetical protein